MAGVTMIDVGSVWRYWPDDDGQEHDERLLVVIRKEGALVEGVELTPANRIAPVGRRRSISPEHLGRYYRLLEVEG